MCFFFDHSHPEDGAISEQKQLAATSLRSHSNAFEVAYILSLLKYLMQQGYKSNDIAIITPYVSQLLALREALRNEFVIELSDLDQAEVEQELGEEALMGQWSTSQTAMTGATQRPLAQVIRLATVDNFQGEEAEIILISLVRSTLQSEERESRDTIGFLKVPNRINVLMSRAKLGLYLVGHGSLLRQKSPLWNKILEMMTENEYYGTGIPIHCQKHPDDHRLVMQPGEFKTLAPNGGCLRPCGLRLPKCGHICRLMCHVDRVSHTSIYCDQPCARLHDECGHTCPKNCGDICGRCEVTIGSITLPCGHLYEGAKCWEASAPSKVFCKILVEKSITSCGHVALVPCGSSNPKCSRKCGRSLPCGHPCQRTCASCVERTLQRLIEDQGELATVEYPITPTEHGECCKKCDRVLSCGHRCKGVCHLSSECPPCMSKCDIFQCAHGGCEHACNLSCTACCEPCTWGCEHEGQCELPCGAPCIRPLCNRRCTNFLLCGHQCPSLCGEKCPASKYCQECGTSEVLKKQVDLILFQSYAEVDVDEDPILVLPCCNSMWTMSSLDGVVELSRAYSEQGQPRPLPENTMIALPKCPNCNGVIHGIERYNRVTKRAAIDTAEQKFIERSQRLLVKLQKELAVMTTKEEALGNTGFAKSVKQFAESVATPPCSKVYQSCVAKLRKSNPKGKMTQEKRRLLPVPNSKFPYPGAANLLLAQYYLLGGTTNKSVRCARRAVELFATAQCEIQLREARLILGHALVTSAATLLSDKATKADAEERAEKIENIAGEVNKLLGMLPTPFASAHSLEIEALQKKLEFLRKCKGSMTFYDEVSAEELHSVRLAMQAEFSGSGHWYRCPNGHMYSVGECGMPMEQARCPECAATMGGTNHTPAAGNVHAAEMDRF